jgi:hypothetical protein
MDLHIRRAAVSYPPFPLHRTPIPLGAKQNPKLDSYFGLLGTLNLMRTLSHYIRIMAVNFTYKKLSPSLSWLSCSDLHDQRLCSFLLLSPD